MRLTKFLVSILLVFGMASGWAYAVSAQETTPVAVNTLTVFTAYPSQEIGIGESVTIPLKLEVTTEPQTVQLSMKEIPEGWTATFRGGGKIINSVYVQPGNQASVDLRLEQPADAPSGKHHFVVLASGEDLKAELSLDLIIREKLPPKLTFSTELPELQGTPSGTFRYTVTLKNEGDEDLNVSLQAQSPASMLVRFKLSGQEVTSLPLSAGESKSLSIEAQPLQELTAGKYPITIQAQSGETQASLNLTARVTGQASLSITTPDGRLSGQANAGKDSPLKIVLTNTGTDAARGVKLSSSEPSGWSVSLNPKEIPEIPAGQQVEVVATIRPAEKALAGDYVITIRANSADGNNKSAEFRITVLTSTLWGVVGVALIAVAVVVVAVAVSRFGRR